MEVKNSSGYFKDPITFEDLSVDTPRAVKCQLSTDNKFTWPMVMFKNGDIGKIVYKYFTDDEKMLYKKYRGYDTSKPIRHRESKPAVVKCIDANIDPGPWEVEDMSATAICSGTAAIVAKCTKYIGTSFVKGITYALLRVGNSNVTYYVPRALIDSADIERLSNGKM